MKPICIIPNCPHLLPMIKLLAESSLTHELYYCPHDGSRQNVVTPLGRVGSAAQPVLAIGGAIAIATQAWSLLHGEPPDLDSLGDLAGLD